MNQDQHTALLTQNKGNIPTKQYDLSLLLTHHYI
jgi:hypothetical protein